MLVEIVQWNSWIVLKSVVSKSVVRLINSSKNKLNSKISWQKKANQTDTKSGDYFLSSIAEEMKWKFDKYWGTEENLSKKKCFILYVIVVLDLWKNWGICQSLATKLIVT